nr:EscU/YscU/HrcU family type III secretion system export apparatus switch protein [Thiosulfativibrio zosterae]
MLSVSTPITLDQKVAITLSYKENDQAPKVTAKGYGHIAEQILAIAAEHNIPIKSDSELTALLSQVELDNEIPEILYEAIVQVLIFAYEISEKPIPNPKNNF